MPIKSILSSALIGLLASAPLASAHTWVEQLMVIAPNGTMVGDAGYARGNVLRGSPGFSDPTMVNLIPPDGRTINQIFPSDLMCKSSQTAQTQTGGSPRLQAAAGDAIALRFQENGHVTLPDNQPGKPSNRGTVYVYGTSKPSADDSFLAIHRVWTADGTGGDGRGQLLSTRNFDDGQCYQTNGGAISQQRQQQFSHPFDMTMGNDLWCQQDIQIPTNTPSGQPYTLYWVWDWPTLPGTFGYPNGKQEIYTTCMDVDIVADTGVVPVSKSQVNFIPGQPYDFAAVQNQMADIANPTAVIGQTIPFTATPNTLLTQAAFSSASSTPLLTSSAPTGSTIAFTASATGPVAGGASEASASAAIASDTGIPAFLSIHTGSTAGPGLETQTFTVVPISVTVPQVTGAPNAVGNAQQVATLTEYESVTSTQLTTVYVTKYTKRDAGESNFATSAPSAHDHWSSAFPRITHTRSSPSADSTRSSGAPHPNHTRPNGSPHFNYTRSSGFPPVKRTQPSDWQPFHSTRPDGSRPFNFTRPTGSSPWFNSSWTPGTNRPSARPTGWGRHNLTNGTGYEGNGFGWAGRTRITFTTAHSTMTGQSLVGLTNEVPSSDTGTPILAQTAARTTVTVEETLTQPTFVPSAFSPSTTVVATADPVATPSHAVTSTSATSMIFPNTQSLSSSSLLSPTGMLTSLPVAEPSTPTPTSTDAAAFRLRARNPFVMLGWMSADAKTTQSS